jgi:hypothetical protein
LEIFGGCDGFVECRTIFAARRLVLSVFFNASFAEAKPFPVAILKDPLYGESRIIFPE